MTIEVPYLSKVAIEQNAERLLAEYQETSGVPIMLPVPVADIATYHLALQLGFADLHQTLGIPKLGGEPDILGVIWVDEETILIDRSLDPGRNPKMLGRYHFSVAHEIGHWRLHRPYVVKGNSQAPYFSAPSKPSVTTRASQARKLIERQADYFAACLLMPRNLMLSTCDPIRFRNLPIEELMDYVVPRMAVKFQVSVEAMRIRFGNFGLSVTRPSISKRLDEFENVLSEDADIFV